MEKFALCVKRCQEGKTFTCISTITSRILEDEMSKRSVHIIYTMNTLLANKQFVARLTSLETLYGKGSVVVFASKYAGKFHHAKTLDTLKGKFMTATANFPRIIVCCSHSVRFNDGVDFINAIDAIHGDKVRMFAYYDELHKYITAPKIRSQIEGIHALKSVEGILAMTATPEGIYSSGVWSNITTHYLDNLDSPNYIGASNHKFINIEAAVELDEVTQGFVTAIADAKKAKGVERDFLRYMAYVLSSRKLLCADARVFAPAMYRQATHAMVRSLIFKLSPSAVVVVMNGIEKTLSYYDDDGEEVTRAMSCNDDEACNAVASLVNKDGLSGRPLVFTGFLCVGMGQTLTCEETGSFTSAVFGHANLTNDDIYQLFGRTCGNMLQWESYCTTTVYCPKTFMHICVDMERVARRMAEEFNGSETSLETIDDIINSGENPEAIINNRRKNSSPAEPKASLDEDDFESEWSEWFRTEKEVDAWWSSHGGKPRALKSVDGYLVCSTSKGPMRHLIGEINGYRAGKKTMNMPRASKLESGETDTRRYVAYGDFADKESVRFCAHWIKRN
jgi:hypothetical protein